MTAERSLKVTIIGDSASVSDMLDKLGVKIDGFEAKVGSSSGKVNSHFEGMSAIAVAKGTLIADTLEEVGKKIIETGLSIIENYAQQGTQIDILSQRTGFHAETLSQLSYVAQLTGTSLDGLEVGIKKMDTAVVNAGRGNKLMIADLQAIGLTVNDLKGLSPEEMFAKITSGIAGVEDPATKSALAVAFFGKTGTQLIPMLDLGTDGLKRLEDQAKATGNVMGDEAAAKAHELDDQMIRLQSSISGVKLKIGEALLPAMSEVVGYLQRLSTDEDLFKGHWDEFWNQLPDSVLNSIETMVKGHMTLISAMQSTADATGIMAQSMLRAWASLADGAKGLGNLFKGANLVIAGDVGGGMNAIQSGSTDIYNSLTKPAAGFGADMKGAINAQQNSPWAQALLDQLNNARQDARNREAAGATNNQYGAIQLGALGGGGGFDPNAIGGGGAAKTDPLVAEWARINKSMLDEQQQLLETGGADQLATLKAHQQDEIDSIRTMADRAHTILGIDMVDAVTKAAQTVDDYEKSLVASRIEGAKLATAALQEQMKAEAALAAQRAAAASALNGAFVGTFGGGGAFAQAYGGAISGQVTSQAQIDAAIAAGNAATAAANAPHVVHVTTSPDLKVEGQQ